MATGDIILSDLLRIKTKLNWVLETLPKELSDKLLQIAAAQILAAIYEQDFLDCCLGYRPKHGA